MSKKLKIIISVVCAVVILVGAVLFFTLRKPSDGNDDKTNAQEIRIFTYSGHEFESVTMDSAMKKIEEMNLGLNAFQNLFIGMMAAISMKSFEEMEKQFRNAELQQ